MHGQMSQNVKESMERNTYGGRSGTQASNRHYTSNYERRETNLDLMNPKGMGAFSSVESSKEQAERNDYLRKSLADADNLSSKSDGSARSRGSRSKSSKDSRNKKIKKK